MSMVQASGWVMLFFGGLWTGGILIFAVERTNLWRRMPIEQYAVDFRRSVFRADPLMPILGGISGVGATIYALESANLVRQFAWASVALMVMVILASVFIAEPMNSKFRRLPEGRLPDDVDTLRSKWRVFHNLRTVVALAALACMSAAAAL